MNLMEIMPASQVVKYSSAKWSKTQPHKGIWWTNKISTGVDGSNKFYIAFSPSKRTLMGVYQAWNTDLQMVRWLAAGQYYDTLDEAKQVVKDMLDD